MEVYLKNVLNFFQGKWLDLPLDQALFKIPGLKFYSVNDDIIINGTYSKSKPKVESYIKRESFPLGKEFWIHPLKLLGTSRFDIMVKYLYAKHYLENDEFERYKTCYYEHIKGWNNFYEGEPLKIGPQAFFESFHELIHNLQENGFDSSAEAVPISNCGTVQNGSHRVGTCLALDIPIKVKVTSISKPTIKKGVSRGRKEFLRLSESTMNNFIYEYVKLKPKTYALACKPTHSSPEFLEELLTTIAQHVDVVYSFIDSPYFQEEGYFYVFESDDKDLENELIRKLSDRKDFSKIQLFSHEETVEKMATRME